MEKLSQRSLQLGFQWIGILGSVRTTAFYRLELADGSRFLAGQMHVFRPRTDLARVLLALAPIVGATLIAISRLEDYRHDVYDVTVGSLLGILVAYFSYSRYYPHLKSAHCDTPYPSRAEWASKHGYGKLKDEEADIGRAASFRSGTTEDDAEHVPLRDTSRERGRIDGSRSEF